MANVDRIPAGNPDDSAERQQTLAEHDFPEMTPPPRSVWLRIGLAVLLLFGLPFALMYFGNGARPEQEVTELDAPRDSVNDYGEIPPAPVADAALEPPVEYRTIERPAPTKTQQQAIEDANVIRLRGQGDRVRQQWSDLKTSSDELAITFNAMLSDEAGKRVAANERFVEQFIALRDKERPAPADIDRIGAELETLLEPLESFGVAQVEANFVTELDRVGKTIREQQGRIDGDLRLLKALNRSTETQEPSDTSLGDVLQRKEDAEAARQLQELTAATRQARQSEIEKMATEAAERERELAEAKAQLKAEQDAAELTKVNAEIAATKQKREDAEKLAAIERDFKKDEAEIRSLLSPFINEGMTQPTRRGFKPSAKKGPVSLGVLRGTGLLEPEVRARSTLYYITSNHNDRPLGSFPRYFGGAAEVQQRQPLMARVQELLDKYGEYMVSKGMLAE